MGCGCQKVVSYQKRAGMTPLETPYQATVRATFPSSPMVWVLSCDGEAPVAYTDQVEAINAARARGCRLEATRTPPAVLTRV